MKKIAVLLLIGILMLSFVGCSPQSTDPTSTAGASNSASPSAAKIRVGFAQAHSKNAWRLAETENVKLKLGNAGYEVVFTDAGGSTEKQLADVEDILAQGVDYLLFTPNDENGSLPALEAANAAGVKVILIDRTVKGEHLVPGVDWVTAIRSNAINEGERVAKWLVNHIDLTAYSESAPYKIVEITGQPGASTPIDRQQGFMDVLKDYPMIKVIATQTGQNTRVGAQEVIESFIQAYGSEIDAVVTQGDEMLLGTCLGIKSMGLTPNVDILVMSTADGGKEAMQLVVNGEAAALAECSPMIGDYCVEVLNTLTRGGTVETIFWTSGRLFTIENAAEAIKTQPY